MLSLLEDGVCTNIVWNSSWEICLFFICLSTQSFIYINMNSWMSIFYFRFSPWYCAYSVAGIIQGLAIRNSLSWLLRSLGIPLKFFWSPSLPLGTTKCFRIILHISHFSPRINHFFKGHRFLLLQNGIRKQD